MRFCYLPSIIFIVDISPFDEQWRLTFGSDWRDNAFFFLPARSRL